MTKFTKKTGLGALTLAALVAFSAGTLAADTTTTAPRVSRSTGEVMDDAWITTKVKAAFLAESEVKGLDVHVETRNNVVMLTGQVDSASQISAATRIAKGIEGVARVDNRLTLQSGAARSSDSTTRDRAAATTATTAGSSAYADADSTFRKYDSNHDGRISRAEFRRMHQEMHPVATGDAADRMEKKADRMEDRADRMDDRTDRSAGQVAKDAAITGKVKAALLADPDVAGLAVNVDTRNGRVNLRGDVDTAAQKAAAERIAKRIEGVGSVTNSLTVRK